MPQYRVLERSFIGNSIVEEGAVVTLDGDAGTNLQLIEAGASPAPEGKPPKKKSPESSDPLV